MCQGFWVPVSAWSENVAYVLFLADVIFGVAMYYRLFSPFSWHGNSVVFVVEVVQAKMPHLHMPVALMREEAE